MERVMQQERDARQQSDTARQQAELLLERMAAEVPHLECCFLVNISCINIYLTLYIYILLQRETISLALSLSLLLSLSLPLSYIQSKFYFALLDSSAPRTRLDRAHGTAWLL